MAYVAVHDSSAGTAKVYASKDGRTSKTFQAVDWLAQLTTHIPNRGESRRWRSPILWLLQQQITGHA